MMSILPDVKSIKNYIISTRRDIHKHPELSFQEYRTSQLVADELEKFGILVKRNIGKTGVVGILKGKVPGKTVALRADMDGLPIQETSNIPYKSINDGVMHACGHDAHTAILLGAAKVLAKYKDNIKGIIKFIFQPAEEGYGGAKFMIKDGAIDEVDEIYGLHVWNYQKSGTVGIQSGPVMAAADMFTIKIKGIGGHGAAPQGTVDSIVISSYLIQSMQTIISRNTNPLESTVITFGQINGGYNFNIIADEVILKGTTRSYTEENRHLIKTRMKEIIKGTEKMFGAKIDLQYKDGYPPVVNNELVTSNLKNIAKSIVNENVIPPYLSMGGEDFSYFSNVVPGCFFFLGSAPKDREPMSTPQHCSHFDIDEDAMLIGSSIFVKIGLQNV
ncbi:MAG: peptidase M20 [Candidatus Marinimicrobia bacterium]|nr:peptidase M20 [Candidatus Neomarinimicrobiota bacterium]|tara:strand:+ start:79187 stop:80350 length:1164 start_codon:yes stop_codon:yes gene_type:complete